MRVLFIGGTGTISSACCARAIATGMEVTVLNRGVTRLRPLDERVEVVHGDIRDSESGRAALRGRDFDVVVEFVAYVPEHVQSDIELFRGRTGQYVFISSASAYQKPPGRLPIVESTPLRNPFWEYSRDKIACEALLVHAYREEGFPATVVRPSSTYDCTTVPLLGGWTDVDRMRRGRPVVVQGDGTSVWVMTHHADFAKGLVGLFGHPQALGESFHITSDEVLTWNQIYESVAAAADVEAHLVHVASDTIAAASPDLGPSLLGDRTHSAIFDNRKIKSLVPEFVATVPFWMGAKEIVAWHDAHPEHQRIDAKRNALFDRLVEATEAKS
jgi:nucleoside-diphosphate-sugar epimerase